MKVTLLSVAYDASFNPIFAFFLLVGGNCIVLRRFCLSQDSVTIR